MPSKRGERSVAAQERRQLRGEVKRAAVEWIPAPRLAGSTAASSSTVPPSTVLRRPRRHSPSPPVEPVAVQPAPVLELRTKAAPCVRRPREESAAGSTAPIVPKRRVRLEPRVEASGTTSKAGSPASTVAAKRENVVITKRGTVIDLDDL